MAAAFGTEAHASDDTGNLTSLACDKPASTVSGDFLVAVINTGSGSTGFTAPSGWGRPPAPLNVDWTDSNDSAGAVFTKTAGGSEPASYTFSWTTQSPVDISIVRITGSNGTIRSIRRDTAGGTGASFTSTALSGTQTGDLIVAVGVEGDDFGITGSTITPPASPWTTINNFAAGPKYQAASWLAGPQSTHTANFASNSAHAWWNIITYAAEPAAAGAVTGSGGLSAKKAVPGGSGSTALTGSGGLSAKKAVPGGSGTASLPPVTHFPQHQLGAKVELLLGGTWTDITRFVQLRSDISISFPRANEASSMQEAEAAFTLNNKDGRFTPGNADGAYYPFVQLNTQVRISVSDTAAGGTAYSGFRFWGEVSSWPSAWDESGRDVYAAVTASGIWRRLSQSTKKIGSPYTRYNNINIGASHTIAGYWPMEDGPGSTEFASTVPTAANMTVASGTPSLAFCTAFPGSDAIPQLNGAELTGTITTSDSPADNIFRFELFVQSGGDHGVAAGARVAKMHTSGTVAEVSVSLKNASGGGPFTITGLDSHGAQLFTGDTAGVDVFGIPILVHVELKQSGSSILWGLDLVKPNSTVSYGSVTGSIAGTVSDATSVIFNPGLKYQGTSVGQAIVIYGNPALLDAADALGGWKGEFAGARFLRVLGEEGIPAVLTGSATSGTTMGPQADDTLANVLQAIEAAGGGFLFETRTQFGLGYRTLATLQDQTLPVILDYAAQQLFAPLSPVTDDQLIRNDVTLTNYDGYAVRAFLAAGARSVQDPPDGVGSGYEYTRDVSCTDHSQVDALAEQLLNSGTVSDPRYPTVTVNLARATTAPLFGTVPALNQGDYLQLANLPAYGGTAAQKQLAWGWTEVLNVKTWTIAFNTVPEAPFESGFAPGTTVTGQVPGSPVTISQAGSVSGGQIAESAISLASLAQPVLSFQFGGITSNINSVAPSDPAVGDLWFDSSSGFQIKRWDGSSWVPVTFDGDNILGAGTVTAGLLAANAVVAGNIAANAVTATQLAAGIIVAGIVDGTTISGAQFVAHGTNGEILAYSGTPAAGNLILSVSATAGTDAHGNAYNAGTWIYDSGGNSIGLVPGSSSAASQIALSSGSGTPVPPAGTSALYGAGSGAVQVVDGADGRPYGTQRRSIIIGTAQHITSSTPSSWISSAVASPAGTSRAYRVHGKALCTATAAGVTLNFFWVGPAGVTGNITFDFYTGAQFNTSGFNAGPGTGTGTRNSPSFSLASGQSAVCAFDGVFSVPAGVSGTFGIQCANSTGSYDIEPNSFMDVMPV